MLAPPYLQGDDGANAMETDVEDDADTVADTKDARDASSPEGVAYCPILVQIALWTTHATPLTSQ